MDKGLRLLEIQKGQGVPIQAVQINITDSKGERIEKF